MNESDGTVRRIKQLMNNISKYVTAIVVRVLVYKYSDEELIGHLRNMVVNNRFIDYTLSNNG